MLSLNILFPVYNEERRLERGIETTCQFMQEKFNSEYVLTIVDNGSTDKTEEISKKLCAKYAFVRYMKTETKGVGAAFQLGVLQNQSDIVGYMDIDLSTDITHLTEMYEMFCKHPEVDIVNASRLNKNSQTLGRKWYRNITSHGLAFIIRTVFKTKATDVICGFKFFKADSAKILVKKVQPDNGWFYIIEALIRAEREHMTIYELPVKWTDDYDTTVHVKKLIIYYLKKIYGLKKTLKKEENYN